MRSGRPLFTCVPQCYGVDEPRHSELQLHGLGQRQAFQTRELRVIVLGGKFFIRRGLDMLVGCYDPAMKFNEGLRLIAMLGQNSVHWGTADI